MSKNFIRVFKVVLSIGIAALLLYLVFKNVDWSDFWQKAKSVNYKWVFLSISLSLITYFARAYRWNILFKPLGYDLKTSRTVLAVLVGYLANLALPRLGEIARCGILNRNDKVPMPIAFGTVVIDRLMDVVALFILIGISLFIEYERLINFLTEAYSDLQLPRWFGIAAILGLVLGTVGLFLFIKKQNKMQGKFAEVIKGFVAGFISLKDIQNPIGFILSTVLIWVIYFFMSYVIVFSLPETSHLGVGAGLMLLITGGIALAIPVQSGFGTYHAMVAAMLLLYGIDTNTGIFLATLLHTSQIVAVAIFGTIALFISFLLRRRQDDSDSTKNPE